MSAVPEGACVSWLPIAAPGSAVDPRIQAQPEDLEYHLKAGMAAMEQKRADGVEHHLRSAMRLAPRDARAHALLAQWHYDEGRPGQAMLSSDQAMALAPDDASIAIVRALILEDLGQEEAAWRLMKPLLEARTPSTMLGVLYGRMAPRLKRETEAMAFMRELLASDGITPRDRAQLHLAIAALLDRAGAYDRAFEHVRLGKEAHRWPYDRQVFKNWIDGQIRYFTPARLHALPRAPHGDRRPVFIIGMPRSGTSLVEQILASHPRVHGGGELRTLWNIARAAPRSEWARGEMYPACLDMMGVRQASQLASAYLAAIAALNGSATYVTDKMPDNFMLMGLIATLFPDSHVIHCRRDPLDTCLSCHMTYFAAGQDYTHDLTDLGAFYRDYHRWMLHWKTALHYPAIEIDYEELVGDLEGQTRRLLELLDLPWDDRCLRYHENRRVTTTASRQQIHQPIYTSSVGRWTHYEKHLGELIAAIGDQRAPAGPSSGRAGGTPPGL